MANDNSASVPQFWAMRGLQVLVEMTPAAQSVNRQFAPQLARAGDQVNAYRAARRVTRRKDGVDSYTSTDATLVPVPVVLDQIFYDSFIIKDEEASLSITDLTRTHLEPAIHTIGRGVDRAILGRVHAFLRSGEPLKRAGRLGKMTKANAADYILEAEEVLMGNLAPDGQRTAIVHHTANTKLMGSDLFQRADARGVNPTVITGEVGVVYNTRVVVSQNVNYVYQPNADIQTAGTISNAGGYPAGTTGSLTTTDPGTDWTVGEFVLIDGNDQPNYITAATLGTAITLDEELKYDVVDTAPIVHFLKCTNEAVVRAAGYKKEMTFTHSSGKNLQVGQLLAFEGTSRHTYTIIEVSASTATTTTVLLDRPLDEQVGSGDDAFPGPSGSMNPVMHKDAIALVTRPMKAVDREKGAASAVANWRGIGLRVVMQYDSAEGGDRVNLDILAGVSVLDVDLLCVMLA